MMTIVYDNMMQCDYIIYIYTVYDESNADVYGSGSGKVCQIETTCPSK